MTGASSMEPTHFYRSLFRALVQGYCMNSRFAEGDPTKIVDDWPLPRLSPADRIKIKSQLLKAHATFHRYPWGDNRKFIEPMQQAFTGIAGVLFEAKLLTSEILEKHLRLFILEAAVSGNWYWYQVDEASSEIFPGYFGHSSHWQHFNQHYRLLFAAEIAEWKSKLLDEFAEQEAQTSRSERIAPKTLREAYFSRFATEKVLDVCWAARQHYCEWKRWLRGAVKEGSMPDRAFRDILTSEKRPGEYRKQPRPAKWK
jgi:hypothetical protein